MDVVPTTAAIHVLSYADPPVQTVHFQDGTIKRQQLQARSLVVYASDESGGTVDPETIDYIEIGLPSDLLRPGLVWWTPPGRTT